MPFHRRSEWLAQRSSVLLANLACHGLTVTEQVAIDMVSEQLDTLAELMGISRRAARHYLTDEAIENLATRIADDHRGGTTGPSSAHPASGG